MGGGILGLPFAMEKLGLVAGCLLLLSMALFGVVSAWMLLIAMEEVRQKSYAEVGNVLFGQVTAVSVDLSIALYNIGVLVSYVMILGDILPDFMHFIGAPAMLQERTALLVASAIFVLWPLSSLPSMGHLRHASLVCLLMIALLAASLVLLAVWTDETSEPLRYGCESGTGFLTQLPVLIFAYTCNMNVPIFYSELRAQKHENIDSKFKTKREKMMWATYVSFVLCFLAYFLVALCGYVAFRGQTQPDILTNLQSNNFRAAPYVKMAYSLVMFTSYPVMAFSCVASIYRLFWEFWSFFQPEDQAYARFEACSPSAIVDDGESSPKVFSTPYQWPNESNLREASDFQPKAHRVPPPVPSWAVRQLLVVAIVAGTVAAGIILPDLSVVFGLTGGFCGGLVSYCFPGAFYVRVARKRSEHLPCGPWLGHVLLYFGLLAGVFASGVVAWQARH